MSDKEYNEWVRQVKEAKTYNNKLLIDFEKHLIAKSLKSNTINNHIFNVRFYINDFLLRYEIIPVENIIQ